MKSMDHPAPQATPGTEAQPVPSGHSGVKPMPGALLYGPLPAHRLPSGPYGGRRDIVDPCAGMNGIVVYLDQVWQLVMPLRFCLWIQGT